MKSIFEFSLKQFIPKILSSSGGNRVTRYIKNKKLGKNQYHISLWDIDYKRPSITNVMKELKPLGNQYTIYDKNIDMNNIDLIVMHGGNTETILNNLKKI